MTTSSLLSSDGLSVVAFRPLVQGSSMNSPELTDNITNNIISYSHTISANGGYISATFSMLGNYIMLNDWLENGIGRHIVTYGPSLNVLWEGFVNQIDVTLGGLTLSRGPLTNIANRVSAVYTEIIESVEGNPITGVTTETIIVEDEDSQEKYGIWEKVLNIGNVWPSDAEYIRDLYLVENANPEAPNSLSISGESIDIKIDLQCRGYIDWVSNYVYNYYCDPVTWSYVSDKIKDILGADPNGIISTNYSNIEENLVAAQDLETENKLAKTIIDDIVALGGGSDDRWMFGIYADREASYKTIPTTTEYIYKRTTLVPEIETINGELLDAWNILPGKWIALPDYVSAIEPKVTNPRDDNRTFFIEEVSFSAPKQATISGAKIRRLSQYLAKLGLGGL